MQIPDYDNAMRWRDLFVRLPFWKKFVCVVIVFVLLMYCLVVPWLLLKINSNLKDEVAKLRDEKAGLHRENLYLKTIVSPIEELTKRRYPDLDTAAAIAKLNEDIENIRALATRDVYKPLAKDRQEKLVAGLKTLCKEFSSLSPSINISCEKGSMVRRKMGSDLEKYLQDSGWKVKISYPLSFGVKKPSNISIKFHPNDGKFLSKFANIINPLFIKEKLIVYHNDKLDRGHFDIKIKGDPLFDDSGVVTFK